MVSSRATSERLSSVLVPEVEGLGDRQRLADAGRLDEQVVEAPLVASRRTSTSRSSRRVQQMQPLVISTSFSSVRVRAAALANELGVDVDLAHVVDDDGDAPALAVVEHAVEQRGLAGAEKAGEHGDGKAGIGHGTSLIVVGASPPATASGRGECGASRCAATCLGGSRRLGQRRKRLGEVGARHLQNRLFDLDGLGLLSRA